MRAISALVLCPARGDEMKDARNWIEQLAALSATPETRSRPSAHSRRPARISVQTEVIDSEPAPQAPWLDLLAELPLLASSMNIALAPHAGTASHVVVLGCSALQSFALANGLGQFAGINSFSTVAIEFSYGAIKLMSEPFGRQVAGRLTAMAESAGIDLYAIAHGPAARSALKQAGFRLYTDIPPSACFPRFSGDAAEQITVSADEFEGADAVMRMVNLIASHEEKAISLQINAQSAKSAGWLAFLEELVLSGIDLNIAPPSDENVSRLMEMGILTSQVLSLATNGDKSLALSRNVWTNRAWRKQAAPAHWLETLIRKEHDRLGSGAKNLQTARTAIRIDNR